MTDTINVYDGFVRLVDTMPVKNLDDSIVQAARVSYADGTSAVRSSSGLIRYLLRHWHTTPFEMVTFKFHMKMPIFIARQHMRHRTASVNELSARYSIVPDEYYEPDTYRSQGIVNKQSSEAPMELNEGLLNRVIQNKDDAFDLYKELIDDGVSRELARCHLPQSTYTEFYWQINLHNLMHYLQLRMEAGAQEEIRSYANAIYKLVQPMCPISMEAFMDFRVNAMQLTGPEIEWLKNETPINNKGELREFKNKLEKLNMDFLLRKL